MPIKLNSSGGGSVTIDVPSTASSFTLTAPAATATLITTGSSGQVIPKAALPTGSVLQVTSNTIYSTQTMSITTSGTLVASGFTLPITPTTNTSKILILYTSTFGSTSSNSGVGGNVQMYRNVGGGSYGFVGGSYNTYWNTIATYIAYQQLSFTIMYLDSPATTSQVIYQPYFNVSCGTAGGLGVLGGRNTDGLQYSGSHMIAMEIAA